LTNAPVAVARNDAFCREWPIREIAFLYHDVLRMARRSIYIEAQYLAAEGIGEILRERLSETNPPGIVIILSRIYPGYLERFVMGRNRERLLRRIVQADHAGKLRVYYPVSRAANAQRSIKIHAKLMIADSCFLKIGSSNLNNRSLGTDVECDAVIAARSEAHRTRIAAVQARLLAEHMQRPAGEVAVRLEETGSLFATIDSLDEGRRLRPHALRSMQGPSSPILLTPLLDPEQPISLRYLAQALCGRPAKMREQRLCDE
jgi:phosphatidylserine/phosphatidylglycerophosphate/cardiolipin synthase-like enzyme